ncbi:hypothetical protein BC829DRAFT_398777 [Chytridium lagenaria]|nr:hypothetical protein BC829DRAFT_398777 [Chytridium lagenaria]
MPPKIPETYEEALWQCKVSAGLIGFSGAGFGLAFAYLRHERKRAKVFQMYPLLKPALAGTACIVGFALYRLALENCKTKHANKYLPQQ